MFFENVPTQILLLLDCSWQASETQKIKKKWRQQS